MFEKMGISFVSVENNLTFHILSVSASLEAYVSQSSTTCFIAW